MDLCCAKLPVISYFLQITERGAKTAANVDLVTWTSIDNQPKGKQNKHFIVMYSVIFLYNAYIHSQPRVCYDTEI